MVISPTRRLIPAARRRAYQLVGAGFHPNRDRQPVPGSAIDGKRMRRMLFAGWLLVSFIAGPSVPRLPTNADCAQPPAPTTSRTEEYCAQAEKFWPGLTNPVSDETQAGQTCAPGHDSVDPGATWPSSFDIVSRTPPSSDNVWEYGVFAPYVSMSNWPVPNLLQLSQANGISFAIVGFIQADSTGNPSWGGYASLKPDGTDSQAVAINRSLSEFRSAGGGAMVSFGGAVGISLSQYYASRNLSARALADTYRAIADTYGVTHIDFDLEGAALSDNAAMALHTQAVALLQHARPDLKIWYTLPVTPTGLCADSQSAVDQALRSAVELAGVNIMAMEYGEYAAPTSGPDAQTMGTYVIQSAQSAYSQLSGIFAKYGKVYSWTQLGVTPMIGVNGSYSEIFTVPDARALEAFARAKGIGMLSMWSLLRDNPGTPGQVSENTSGIADPSGSFSEVFNRYGTGRITQGTDPDDLPGQSIGK